MSANNYLQLDLDKLVIRELDMDTGKGTRVGKAKDLKHLIEEAQKILQSGECEYGAWFLGKIKDDK